jgi:hypothetical protein
MHVHVPGTGSPCLSRVRGDPAPPGVFLPVAVKTTPLLCVWAISIFPRVTIQFHKIGDFDLNFNPFKMPHDDTVPDNRAHVQTTKVGGRL